MYWCRVFAQRRLDRQRFYRTEREAFEDMCLVLLNAMVYNAISLKVRARA